MSGIYDLAREFNAQPYEVEAFYGETIAAWNAELDPEIEAMIREHGTSDRPMGKRKPREWSAPAVPFLREGLHCYAQSLVRDGREAAGCAIERFAGPTCSGWHRRWWL